MRFTITKLTDDEGECEGWEVTGAGENIVIYGPGYTFEEVVSKTFDNFRLRSIKPAMWREHGKEDVWIVSDQWFPVGREAGKKPRVV